MLPPSRGRTLGRWISTAPHLAGDPEDVKASGQMRDMSEPIVSIDSSDIREGRVEDLKAAMTRLVEFVRENEPRPIAYDVYMEGGRHHCHRCPGSPGIGIDGVPYDGRRARVFEVHGTVEAQDDRCVRQPERRSAGAASKEGPVVGEHNSRPAPSPRGIQSVRTCGFVYVNRFDRISVEK